MYENKRKSSTGLNFIHVKVTLLIHSMADNLRQTYFIKEDRNEEKGERERERKRKGDRERERGERKGDREREREAMGTKKKRRLNTLSR